MLILVYCRVEGSPSLLELLLIHHVAVLHCHSTYRTLGTLRTAEVRLSLAVLLELKHLEALLELLSALLLQVLGFFHVLLIEGLAALVRKEE